MTKEKIFVTGGSGFLGRNLIRRLISDGYEVCSLCRSDKAQKTVASIGANHVLGSLDDIEKMQNAMNGCSTIYHIASNTNSSAAKNTLYRDNVRGTQNVIKAAKFAKIPLLIYISTDAVLMGKKPLVNVDENEKGPKRFCGNYAKTKSISEQEVILANCDSVKTIVLRPRLIWGNDDSKFLPSLTRKVDKKIFFWINEGRYLTSTCHVYNVCEGLILAKKYGHGGAVYFVTDGKPMEFRNFVTSLLSTKGIIPPDRSIPFWMIKNLILILSAGCKIINKKPPISVESLFFLGRESTLNDSKARKEINYMPVITFQAGLNELNNVNKLINDNSDR